ncbi:MAG TPA: class I SAM-dependent methyltransferase [Ferrovibrio sp.]|uniref:class I SAM-dependent methyltransferase n=1 Tax=Ferrovibrio sp. TaxID=1917215 RepID=UPI002ED670AF
MTDSVKQQYEAYPYPARDPADEKRRLITGSPSFLPELNHYVFAGRRDFTRPFRALVAGGGTGDGLIHLAQYLQAAGQTAGGAHEVVYLDLSAAARAIAEARARMRGLSNIRFITGSLLDLAALAPGPYDYIDCCGVLHHLPDPAAGLAALVAQLSPDGGLGLMVYGRYGRAGIYPLQAALRQLTGDLPPPGKIALARTLLSELPEGNEFRRNPFVGDHKTGDAGLYDLLLHSQDRAYTVPELAALIEGAGLSVTAWIEPCRYDPLSYLKDNELRRRAAALPPLEQAALAERLSGAMKTHVAYAVPRARAAEAVAQPAADLIPWLNGVPPKALAETLAKRGELTVTFHTERFVFAAPPRAAEIAALLDGRRSLGEIAQALGLSWEDFSALYAPLHALLTGINKLYLRGF